MFSWCMFGRLVVILLLKCSVWMIRLLLVWSIVLLFVWLFAYLIVWLFSIGCSSSWVFDCWIECLFGCLIQWLTEAFVDRLLARLIAWIIVWSIGRLFKLVGYLIDRLMGWIFAVLIDCFPSYCLIGWLVCFIGVLGGSLIGRLLSCLF